MTAPVPCLAFHVVLIRFRHACAQVVIRSGLSCVRHCATSQVQNLALAVCASVIQVGPSGLRAACLAQQRLQRARACAAPARRRSATSRAAAARRPRRRAGAPRRGHAASPCPLARATPRRPTPRSPTRARPSPAAAAGACCPCRRALAQRGHGRLVLALGLLRESRLPRAPWQFGRGRSPRLPGASATPGPGPPPRGRPALM